MSQVFLPIFPLPEITFFPHTFLPLHIFEARYRAMLTDALARDKRLAVVGLTPGYEADYDGKPPVFTVAGAGTIVQWERLATGRFNILLKGDCRIRIDREIPADTLYRIVRATSLSEAAADGANVTALVVRVKDACRRILRAVDRPSAEMNQVLDAAASPGVLCDQVASALVPGAALRQALLEELCVERRLERLVGALSDLVKQLER